MPKKQTKTLAIIFLLLDIISISFFIFLFQFTKSLIAESIKGENDIKIELKKEDTRTLMKYDLALSKMYQEKLMDYVVPSGGTVDFIKIIEQLVSNCGLKYNIKTISNEVYNEGNALGGELLKISVDITGEWKNIQFFLKSLENYPLKINIKKISLSKFSDYKINGKNIPQWSGSFEFTVVKMK